MITSVPRTCSLVQPSETIQCVTRQGKGDISLEQVGRGEVCPVTAKESAIVSYHVWPAASGLGHGRLLLRVSWQNRIQPCPEMHPPCNLYSVYPCIKWFLLYIERTSMRNQSKFHACDTFVVRVSRGCILWQDITRAMCHAYGKCMWHVAPSYSKLAGGALHLHQMENKASPALHPCVGQTWS